MSVTEGGGGGRGEGKEGGVKGRRGAGASRKVR